MAVQAVYTCGIFTGYEYSVMRHLFRTLVICVREGVEFWLSLWLSVEMLWLAVGGPILALFAQIGLENTALTL